MSARPSQTQRPCAECERMTPSFCDFCNGYVCSSCAVFRHTCQAPGPPPPPTYTAPTVAGQDVAGHPPWIQDLLKPHLSKMATARATEIVTNARQTLQQDRPAASLDETSIIESAARAARLATSDPIQRAAGFCLNSRHMEQTRRHQQWKGRSSSTS